ncbi:type VI secretion system tube protein TssD [Pedobacter nototheniae]|uniref:type VI secretion system tube protein TssD n=1 Tax=Pedobacter nototheniae TaxID=2488994 RepID=UPI00292EA488|nr:type VI secretion system tube protein TssD [Pedobacter nototheniae]
MGTRTHYVRSKPQGYCCAIMLLLLFFGFNVLAQDETQMQIEFKLSDSLSNTSHSYKLLGINYALNTPYYSLDENELINNGNCSITMELAQDVDEFFLKWIAGTVKNASGTITMLVVNGIKKPRKITFTGGQVAGFSESFYSTVGANTSPQVSIYVKKLSVDDVSIFTTVKPKINR